MTHDPTDEIVVDVVQYNLVEVIEKSPTKEKITIMTNLLRLVTDTLEDIGQICSSIPAHEVGTPEMVKDYLDVIQEVGLTDHNFHCMWRTIVGLIPDQEKLGVVIQGVTDGTIPEEDGVAQIAELLRNHEASKPTYH